jgi:hypothetical protein
MAKCGKKIFMKRARKDLPQEVRALKERLKTLVHKNMNEARRTCALLQETERKIENRFALLDFLDLESAREKAAKKFRNQPNPARPGIDFNVATAKNGSRNQFPKNFQVATVATVKENSAVPGPRSPVRFSD